MGRLALLWSGSWYVGCGIIAVDIEAQIKSGMKQMTLYKNGNSLSYAEYGDKKGYPILVQHGLIASIRDYHLFDTLIELGARLICIARPGYGESSPYRMTNMAEWGDIVAVLVDELNLSQFDILGMSSGAPYSYAIGYKFPNKARNLFIFSGIPALYDERILSFWPYAVTREASLAEMETLAHELFFSNVSKEDLLKNDIQDSMMNNCFGIAQDLMLRCVDWGFCLPDIQQNVYMQHSKFDSAVPFVTAEMTSKLLPNGTLKIKENDIHFSQEALDDFISTVIAEQYAH
jgi:pimeloyl-ACP methyl ester carboxylesterase